MNIYGFQTLTLLDYPGVVGLYGFSGTLQFPVSPSVRTAIWYCIRSVSR